MENNFQHRPVLLDEVLQGLAVKPNGIYVDATFGRGGHTQAILAQLGPEGRLIALDKDPTAIAHAEFLKTDKRFTIVHASFSRLEEVMEEQGCIGEVDGLLLDLGVSSPQLDDPERGFSFLRDGPLDMRMDPTMGIDAATWINSAKAATIAEVLREYGEERFAKRISAAIVAAREEAPITTTAQLAKIVAEANPRWEIGKNPATRSFQAIRIFINQELNELKLVLNQALTVLKVGGRLAVISFHSLEDRVVKQFMQKQEKGDLPADLPVRQVEIRQRLRILGRAVKPAAMELDLNPRSRSAVLRIAEKIS